jgi:hypothetical protein
MAALLGCCGTDQHARPVSDLSLKIAPGATTLQAGGTLSLTAYLRNNGSQPINICLKNEDGAAITDSHGKRWPLKLTSVVFDADCSEQFRLMAGQPRRFSDELAVWPDMAEGPGVLEVWLHLGVFPGRSHRPGADQKLIATVPVLIRRRS